MISQRLRLEAYTLSNRGRSPRIMNAAKNNWLEVSTKIINNQQSIISNSLLIAHYSLLSRVLASSQLWGLGLIRGQMLAQFPTVNKVLLTARTFVSVSMMKRFVILETLRGAETIFVFHEVKIDVTLGGGNYSSLKSIIFSSSSPTLFFLLFTSLLPPFSQY